MSATTQAPTGAPAAQSVVTPSVRQAGRRARFWIVAAILALLVALASILISGAVGPPGDPLSPTNAAPRGSKALAQVLRSQGVTVTATDSMLATRAAARDAASTTIFVVDDHGFLGADQLRELARLSSSLVLLTPDFDQLEAIAPELGLAGAVTGTLEADCDLGPVQRAGRVTGTGTGFRILAAGADALECLGSGDDVHSLIRLTRGEKQLTVVGTRDAFANQTVQNEGNAALALGLLGENANLVWLLPSIDEASAPGEPGSSPSSFQDLTPAWVSAVMVLLLLTAVAAAFWRGRRFGPLVVENLPVVVRASETMEGRARLYQRSSARLRALDALRIGTIERLGALCGLPRLASVDEVIRSVSAATGRPLADLAGLLRDEDPAGEQDLVRLSDALLALERATAAALRPAAATITTTPTIEPGE